MKTKIRWTHWANQQGWKFPSNDELLRLWPLDHFDAPKEVKA